jgi:hypothetical protein
MPLLRGIRQGKEHNNRRLNRGRDVHWSRVVRDNHVTGREGGGELRQICLSGQIQSRIAQRVLNRAHEIHFSWCTRPDEAGAELGLERTRGFDE